MCYTISMSTTATTTVSNLSDWRRRAIRKSCFKYCVDLNEIDKVHFFKTIKEVKAFVARLPYYQRHNYKVWKMMADTSVDNLNDEDCYWLQDLSYASGGIVAYGDQWKGFYHNFVDRPNCYLYRNLSNLKTK